MKSIIKHFVIATMLAVNVNSIAHASGLMDIQPFGGCPVNGHALESKIVQANDFSQFDLCWKSSMSLTARGGSLAP